MQPQEPELLRAAFEFAGAQRVILHPVLGAGHADFGQRAAATAGLARQAQGGTQIHHALGIALHGKACGRIAVLRGQQGLRRVPQRAGLRGLGQIAAKAQRAAEHAAHIGVQNRHPLAKTQRRNRRCGRAPNARQVSQLRGAAWKRAAVGLHHRVCASMQITRAAVVPQATPQTQDIVLRRGSQRADRRKARHEAVKVAHHGGHLGLLQHDLRGPDAVGVCGVLPGQVVAAMQRLPVGNPLRNRKGLRGHAFWHRGQKNVARWPCRMLRMGVAHTLHGCAARPYTMASNWK